MPKKNAKFQMIFSLFAIHKKQIKNARKIGFKSRKAGVKKRV
jgi:hypothetical protein